MDFIDEADAVPFDDKLMIRFSLKDEELNPDSSAENKSIFVVRSNGYKALSKATSAYDNPEEVFREWRKQEKVLRHTFPYFDLYAECADPDTADEFIGYLLCGVDLKTAYETAKMRVVNRYELSSRDRNRRALRRQVDAFAPVLRILMAKYDIIDKYFNPVDISKDLLRAISAESADYLSASERGITVNEYRKALLQEQHKRSVEEYIQERAKAWEVEAQSTKRHYPDFDLQSELDNPETGWRFRRYLYCSAHVTVAYELVHLQTAFMKKKKIMKDELNQLVALYESKIEQLNREKCDWNKKQQAIMDEINRLRLENQEYVATAMEKGEAALRTKEADIIALAERNADAKFVDERKKFKNTFRRTIVFFTVFLLCIGLFASSWANGRYKAGFDSGNASGRSSGYNDGRDNGYKYGHSAGYHAGYKDGEEYGRVNGSHDGYTEGYENGYLIASSRNPFSGNYVIISYINKSKSGELTEVDFERLSDYLRKKYPDLSRRDIQGFANVMNEYIEPEER